MKKVTAVLKATLVLMVTLLLTSTVNAQCEKWENYPGGKEEAQKEHVLYRDFVKKKEYAQALSGWNKMYEACFGASEWHALDGVKIYSALAKAEADAAKKKEYQEKVIEVYDRYIACYGAKKTKSGQTKDLNLLYRKGMYAYKTRNSTLAYATLKEHMEKAGNSTKASVYGPLSYYLVKDFKEEKLTKEEMRTWYDKFNEVANFNIENSADEKNKKNFQAALTKIEKAYQPIKYEVFDCDYFTAELKPKYDEYIAGKTSYTDADVEYLKTEVLANLKKANCGDEDEFAVAVVGKINEMRKAIQVTNRTNETKGYLAEKEKDYEAAISFFEAAIAEDGLSNSKKASLSLRIAKLKLNQNNPQSAVSYANKALGFDSGMGEAYITIGDAYMKGSRSCGGSFEQRAVAWVAVDMYVKAKSVDPSIADKANGRIGRYSGSFPTNEEIFQRPGMSVGGSYKVGCWINRTTKVRSN